MQAFYYQGAFSSAQLAPGPLAPGMIFMGHLSTGSLLPPTSWLGPLVNPGSYAWDIEQVANTLVPGQLYTVTAIQFDTVTPRPNDPGAHLQSIDDHSYDAGDQVTLSGLGTVPTTMLMAAYRVS